MNKQAAFLKQQKALLNSRAFFVKNLTFKECSKNEYKSKKKAVYPKIIKALIKNMRLYKN